MSPTRIVLLGAAGLLAVTIAAIVFGARRGPWKARLRGFCQPELAHTGAGEARKSTTSFFAEAQNGEPL